MYLYLSLIWRACVAMALDIAQYQGSPVGRWQSRDSRFERCGFGFCDQRRLRGPAVQIRCANLLALQLSELIDEHKCRGAVVPQPSAGRIAHDCQKNARELLSATFAAA